MLLVRLLKINLIYKFMSNPEQSGVDPEVKEQINTEGFEGNEKGGAAVIIGKEGEEIDKLRKRVESEGVCADAATYVRLNKSIGVPKEEYAGKDFGEWINTQKRRAWMGSTECVFIDSQGNIATLIIDYKKIKSIPKQNIENWEKLRDSFQQELKRYGFNFDPNGFRSPDYYPISRALVSYQSAKEKEAEEKKQNEFDF